MKLEVGMYVRTKKGIRQIIKIDEDNNYYIDKTYINDFRQEIDCISDSCIIGEPTFNPIDLIEVGDYVNGSKVSIVESEFIYWETGNAIHYKYIETIVTKEQYKSMEYRLGE